MEMKFMKMLFNSKPWSSKQGPYESLGVFLVSFPWLLLAIIEEVC